VVAQITRMVQQAQSSRAPMERLSDRASANPLFHRADARGITFGVWLIAAHSLALAMPARLPCW